ncbi:hypothetical protein [Catellatospora citrea]|uniref:Lipoprotein n=1 Tax=Catellatospora citrea TaxID=53366 RepID=A0A8J3P4S3_9ACTN|nr:hypothetical protein [Catellatospora citrea]GIG01526.1 hypothetical protein Cci01nite_66190 [Catellatospora citrea]
MRRAVLSLCLIAACWSVSACGGGTPETTASSPAPRSTVAAMPTEPRAQLAARAAAAKDLRQVAAYTFKSPKRPDRRVVVTRAVDGTWRIDVPGGAHSGAVDIALVFAANSLHQCAIAAGNHPYSGCVRIAGALPAKADLKIQHLITDWQNLLTDRRLAIAVAEVAPLPGARGKCYSVESSAASMKLPLDAGIYCYEIDGTLTAVKVAFGTLLLEGTPGLAPPSVQLPGPVVPGQPLPLTAPPSPKPSTSSSASPSPSPKA